MPPLRSTILGLAAAVTLASAPLAAPAPATPEPNADVLAEPARAASRIRLAMRARLACLADELDLTDAQREAIASVLRQHAGVLRERVSDEADARRALWEATARRPTDAGAIQLASEELARAMAEARIAIGGVRDEIRAHLTPEQAARVDQRRDRIAMLIERGLAEDRRDGPARHLGRGFGGRGPDGAATPFGRGPF